MTDKQKKIKYCLTKIWIIEKDKLLPAVLRHHLHDDLIEINRWADHQGVVICSGNTTGGWAGRTGSSHRGALDKEMGDVHGIGQGLKAARRHAANWANQCQDASIHQLTGWMEGNKEKRTMCLLDLSVLCYTKKNVMFFINILDHVSVDQVLKAANIMY